MAKILLVADLGEEVQFFGLEVSDKDEVETLKTAHGKYVNTCGNTKPQDEALAKVFCAITEPKNREGYEVPKEWMSKRWDTCNLDTKKPVDLKGYDRMIHIGFPL